MRAWLPATVVALALAIGLGVAGYFTFGHAATRGVSPPTPARRLDPRSKEAVVTAVRHYYEVESEARKSGNADLIDSVTLGRYSIASQNFHAFVAQQTSLGKRSVTVATYFRDWSVTISGEQATVNYTFWERGQDVDFNTGASLEADATTSKGSYRMTTDLRAGHWLVAEGQLLQDNVP